MSMQRPGVGEWYRLSSGELLEVVAFDAGDGTIEVQYFDGTVEELEVDEWLEDEFESTEPPEDWTGSLDVEPEDTENEYEAEPGTAKAWADPLQFVDRGEAAGYSEIDLPEADEGERY